MSQDAATPSPPARRSPLAVGDCNLARAFAVIGDPWSLLILRSALHGLRRFDDFHEDIGVPRSVLSGRLARLVEAGLLTRRDYREPGARARAEYWLTAKGRALGLPFFALTEWGDRWLGEGEAPLTLAAKSSGQRLRVALVDEAGRPVRGDDVEVVVRKP